MTAVPRTFNAEPGYLRCGNSFDTTIVVTGEIPGRNGFGRNRKKSLPRVAKIPTGAWWSKQSAQEASFRSQIVSRLSYTRSELAANIGDLNSAESQSIEWLLALAEGNLERVDRIYRYWEGNATHPETGQQLPVDPDAPSPIGAGTYARPSEWPLTASDAIIDYMPECTGKNAALVEDRELIFGRVQKIRDYFCPGEQTRQQRARDRAQILELLYDAARAVRCAQYGLWRIVLYKQSLAEWEERYGEFVTLGGWLPQPQPRPGTQAGGGLGVYVPPREPPGPTGGGIQGGGSTAQPHGGAPDWDIPPPDDLPDPGPDGPGGPGGGTQTGPGLGGSLLPSIGGSKTLVPLAAIAVGGVALYYFLQGTR